jgi:hypothetical protein
MSNRETLSEATPLEKGSLIGTPVAKRELVGVTKPSPMANTADGDPAGSLGASTMDSDVKDADSITEKGAGFVAPCASEGGVGAPVVPAVALETAASNDFPDSPLRKPISLSVSPACYFLRHLSHSSS